MITKPMDVLEKFEVRKTGMQKDTFIKAVTEFVRGKGFEVHVESGKGGCRNIVIGDAENAKFLVTAHYDTPASIGIPNFITPCNPAAFIAVQLMLLIPFFAAAFFAALAAVLLGGDDRTVFLAAYIAYFGLLFLMMFGPANRHNANDNTSGVVTVLETMCALPEDLKGKVAFILFDLEEAGLVGSASYRKAHKEQTEHQIILNLDCVGDGDNIVLFPVKKVKKNEDELRWLESAAGPVGEKHIIVRGCGFSYYPSDQRHFPHGVGISALKKVKVIGFYCDRIHTWRDIHLDEENVAILRDMLIGLISRDVQ